MSKAERILALEQRVFALEQDVKRLLAATQLNFADCAPKTVCYGDTAPFEERRVGELQRDDKEFLPYLHNRARGGQLTSFSYEAES